jgi:hypothetical protein
MAMNAPALDSKCMRVFTFTGFLYQELLKQNQGRLVMSLQNKEEENQVTTFQYISSIGLFVGTLLMWLLWNTSSTVVILTGLAALTVILKRYQQTG